jgi:hypothetical protein
MSTQPLQDWAERDPAIRWTCVGLILASLVLTGVML